MTIAEIISLRLMNHHLLGRKFATAYETVSYNGATQAQDYLGASWSLGQRVTNATEKTIDQAYNDGEIIRTHIMRPTWHFVAPEDLVWMQKITAHRVKQLMAHYNRKLELDEALFNKTASIIVKLLGQKTYATRQEIKEELTNAGVITDVQRLAHIVMWAELDALICSGPKVGKQFTYALVDERIKKHTKLTRDEALAALAKRYVTSHGPAQLKDFSWWSGLTIKEAAEGITMIESTLVKENVDGKIYWMAKELQSTKIVPPHAFLFSIYDEYIIAYADRSSLLDEQSYKKLFSQGNAITGVMIFAGEIIGSWKKKQKKDVVELLLNPFEELTQSEQNTFEETTDNYAKFLNKKVIMQLG